MLPIQKKLRLIIIGLSYCIVLGLLTNIFFNFLPVSWNICKHLDEFFYNIYFTPTANPPANLFIIDSYDENADVSRALYAEIIDYLSNAGAKCIAFDIVFSEVRNHDIEGNQKLIKSVQENPQVILAIDFKSRQQPSAIARDLAEKLSIPASDGQEFFIPNIVVSGGLDLPFYDLLLVSKHIGHINPIFINPLKPENYHFPLALVYLDSFYASLPLEIKKACSQDGEYSFILNDIPLDRDGQLMINFIPEEDFRPNYFLWNDIREVVQNQPDRFNNSIILIINSLADDDVTTPLGIMPRWTLMASITSQLLKNDNIGASVLFCPALVSVLLVFVGLIWFLFVTPRMHKKWRKTRFIFIPCNVIFMLLIFLLLRFGQLWIGVVIPLILFNISFITVRSKYYQWIKPPIFDDLVIQVLERQGDRYPVKVTHSCLGEEEGNAFFDSFIEESAFQKYLKKIQELSAEKNDINWMGSKLFNAIFQGDLFYILKGCIEKATSQDKYLRIRMSIDPDELICLPWELMHSDKIPPGYLLLNKKISLTRYISLFQPVVKPQFKIPLKILVVTSSPNSCQPLDIKGEINLLKKSLRLMVWGGDVKLKICKNTTIEKLHRELKNNPDVLHYIGHSYFDYNKNQSFLCFETESGDSDLVDEEIFGNILHDSSVKLMVLNSCESATASKKSAFTGIAQNLVKIGVPAVLAMQFEILDDSAKAFSSSFYSKFITHYSIEVAVAEARRSLMIKRRLDHPDWCTPVLFMRSGDIFPG